MGDSRIKDVSSLLAAFFDEDKLRKGGRYAEFFGSWKAIAGERLAAHSRVVDVDHKLLIVEAEHPGWVQLLQLRQAELLRAVSERFPELELRGILFRIGVGHSNNAGATSERIGPFGPGARPPMDGPVPAHGGNGKEAYDGDAAATQVSLAAIADPVFRSLLEGLKSSMDDES